MEECEHNFTFLRQQETNVGYDRNPRWLVEDVYFCSRCLAYRRKKLREEVPSSDAFGRRIVVERFAT